MKIIGEIDIENIISDSPVSIFDKYKEDLCISQEEYFRYFYNTNIAYAIKIKNIRKYSIPKNLDEFGLKRAPQSYIYLL